MLLHDFGGLIASQEVAHQPARVDVAHGAGGVERGALGDLGQVEVCKKKYQMHSAHVFERTSMGAQSEGQGSAPCLW